MRRLVASLPLVLLLAACSPTPEPPPSTEAPSTRTSADTGLGSATWYAWVDRSLSISEGGQALDPGSDEWNQAVQDKLGEVAPQSELGSPQWQQSVDALLRTRVPRASRSKTPQNPCAPSKTTPQNPCAPSKTPPKNPCAPR